MGDFGSRVYDTFRPPHHLQIHTEIIYHHPIKDENDDDDVDEPSKMLGNWMGIYWWPRQWPWKKLRRNIWRDSEALTLTSSDTKFENFWTHSTSSNKRTLWHSRNSSIHRLPPFPSSRSGTWARGGWGTKGGGVQVEESKFKVLKSRCVQIMVPISVFTRARMFHGFLFGLSHLSMEYASWPHQGESIFREGQGLPSKVIKKCDPFKCDRLCSLWGLDSIRRLG
jgi:hypothetical protein